MSNPSSPLLGDMPVSDDFPPATPESLTAAHALLLAERERVAALSLFARRVAHDMSNFITVVRTYSELLLADLAPASAMHGDVLEIHRTADAMIEYTGRIARFARAGSARPSAILLDDIVRDVLSEFSMPGNLSAELVSACPVHIDATWLADALREVLKNAREAAVADGSIAVATRCVSLSAATVDGGMPIDAGFWAVVQIDNSGTGFPGESPRHSIDPFVTTKSGIRGAGFGLALARSAMWHAGGHLVVGPLTTDSTGTTVSRTSVRLWLPVDTESSRGAAHP